jgi:hypothetical protein
MYISYGNHEHWTISGAGRRENDCNVHAIYLVALHQFRRQRAGLCTREGRGSRAVT